mgnify:CR=1 FL=1|tara:strand:- start:878 stop:1570 length:693 start_codon:yes stop_codon:yes gene_type:complete
MNSPKHVAIIMDGNGRWGIKKKNSRNYGHKKGLETVEHIITAATNKKIKYLTLFVFSTENWKRPVKEINYLLKLLDNYINKEINNLIERNIKIKVIGNINPFPKLLKKKIRNIENITKDNKKIQVNMALNYGSRQEIISAINKIKKNTKIINENNINKYLYTSGIPEPDILIRTGNTNRISNFLIWQLIYTEIFFLKKMWPDFNKNDFNKIINQFSKINRKYGGLNERVK